MQCRLCTCALDISESIKLGRMPSLAQYLPDTLEDSKRSQVDLVIASCDICGLVQTLNPPAPYYREAIRNASLSTELMSHRRKRFQEFITKYNLIGKNIVEIGCGQGELINLMSQLQVNVQGTEWNDEYVAYCRSQGQNVKKTYPLEDNFFPSFLQETFDGFYTMQFLEHCPSPKDFLLRLQRILNPGAVGIVEVPNYDLIQSNGLVNEFMVDHVTYFSKETLTRLLSSTGFRVNAVDSLFHEYILSVQVEKATPNSLSAFRNRYESMALDGRNFIEVVGQTGIVVWGAGHQAMANIKLFDLEKSIHYVVDSAPSKQGKFIPSTDLVIKSPEILRADSSISTLVLMSAGFNDEIRRIVISDFKFIQKLFEVNMGRLIEISLPR